MNGLVLCADSINLLCETMENAEDLVDVSKDSGLEVNLTKTVVTSLRYKIIIYGQ